MIARGAVRSLVFQVRPGEQQVPPLRRRVRSGSGRNDKISGNAPRQTNTLRRRWLWKRAIKSGEGVEAKATPSKTPAEVREGRPMSGRLFF